MLKMPTIATLRKYGLSVAEWKAMAAEQDHLCFVCRGLPKSGRLHIDHEHVLRWKKKPPEERRRFVRGLLCFRCNTTFVGRGITVDRARRVWEYLERYLMRRSQ